MKKKESDNRRYRQQSEATRSSDQHDPGHSGSLSDGSRSAGAHKRPIYQRWWFWLLVILIVVLILSSLSGGEQGSPANTTGNQDVTAGWFESSGSPESSGHDVPVATAEGTSPVVSSESTDPSPVASSSEMLAPGDDVFELPAGHYTAGIDLPSGRCDVRALAGEGNLSSTNMFSGGINEMFGIDDGSGFYTDAFSGLKLPEGTILSIGGTLTIEITYRTIDGSYSGRTYDEAHSIELASGNFLAGQDFPAGIYSIAAVSGQGNLSSSNMFSEGVNEMFGIDDGSGFYLSRIDHVNLADGTELSVSNGVAVRLIPVIEH